MAGFISCFSDSILSFFSAVHSASCNQGRIHFSRRNVCFNEDSNSLLQTDFKGIVYWSGNLFRSTSSITIPIATPKGGLHRSISITLHCCMVNFDTRFFSAPRGSYSRCRTLVPTDHRGSFPAGC